MVGYFVPSPVFKPSERLHGLALANVKDYTHGGYSSCDEQVLNRNLFHDAPLNQSRNFKMLAVALVNSMLLVSAVASIPFAHAASPVSVVFIDQFGTSNIETATSVDTFDSGVFVAGVEGPANMPGDGFLRKYDTDGNFQWHELISTPESDSALHVSADSTGVYVAGFTDGDLEGTSLGSSDAFVRKYDHDGNVQWTVQFGTFNLDVAQGLAVDSTGVYVSGHTSADLGGTNLGLTDAYLRKYDHDGNAQWTVQFGTEGYDHANSVAVDGSGVYTGGGLNGTTGTSTGQAYVNKYDFDGNLEWMDQFGTVPGSDAVTEVATGSSGVYATGEICCDENDRGDIFLTHYDTSGNQQFLVVSTAPGSDQPFGLAVDASGVYIGGGTTSDLVDPVSGGSDAFVRKYDGTGTIQWTYQFGSTSSEAVFSVALNDSGIYLVGNTFGAIEGTSGGSIDAFAMKIAESPTTTISIDIKPGDTKNTISVNNDKSIKVAILGSASFSVTLVDVSALADGPLFGGLTPRTPVSATYEDVNGDGFTDVVLKYNSGKQNPLGFTKDFTSACLSGTLTDGTPIEGCDRIRVVK